MKLKYVKKMLLTYVHDKNKKKYFRLLVLKKDIKRKINKIVSFNYMFLYLQTYINDVENSISSSKK